MPDVSKDADAPPPVRSRIAWTGSVSLELTAWSAPSPQRQLQPLRHDVDGNYPGAHGLSRQGPAEADGSLSKDRNGVLPVDLHFVETGPGRAGPAGYRRSFFKRKLVRQVYQGAGRDEDIIGVGPVGGPAPKGNVAAEAQLLETHGANLTDPATGVVVADYPVAQLEAGRGAGPQLLNHAAGFVAGDHHGGPGVSIPVQVSAA